MTIKIIDKAFEEFNTQNINYVLLRSLDSLYSSADIDILCAPEDTLKLKKILKSLNFVHIKSPGHTPHQFYMHYDYKSGRWLKFDVMSKVSFGFPHKVHDFLLTDAFLNTKKLIKDIYVLNTNSEFIQLSLHSMLDKNIVSEKYIDRINELTNCNDFSSEEIKQTLTHILHDKFSVSDLISPNTALSDDLLVHLNSIDKSVKKKTNIQKAKRFFYTYSKGILTPRATIALIGPDGVGKSTVIRELQESIPFRVKTVYMGWSDHEKTLKLPTSRWIYRRYNKPKKTTLETTQEMEKSADALQKETIKVLTNKPKKMTWKQVPGMLNEILEQYARYLHARYFKLGGSFVLFDRYVYDQHIYNASSESDKVSPQDKFLAKFYKRFFPDPDLIILLSGDADIIHARKDELPKEKIAQRIKLYESLGNNRSNFHIIDVNEPLETELKNITQVIWNKFKENNV